MEPCLKGKDILTGYQFTNAELNLILNTAAQYEKRVKAGEVIRDMEGMVVATLFFEPSTRTRLSFEAAINRVGAKFLSMADAKASSSAKGETMADTIKTVDGYVDAIVQRHPEKGSAQVSADAAIHPVINGGDGAGQHPTQALLDIYTIRKEKAISAAKRLPS
jgi:aspartate carbamoyltransferase catalytic subunit